MSDSASPSAFLDGRVVTGQKALLYGFLLMLASLATAVSIYGIVYIVSAQNDREAGRMMIDDQKGTGYLAMVTRSLAAHHGRAGKGS